MRGKQVCRPRLVGIFRITPAHAGKTPHFASKAVSLKDHPRACGENLTRKSAALQHLGLPPRMRGKQLAAGEFSKHVRITPAHAGKTISRSTSGASGRDHPRACGENIAQAIAKVKQIGSPPRMRGKLSGDTAKASPDGITPAHAGKTRSRRSATSSSRDHPRACGENAVPRALPSPAPGSPPRMRGKPFLLLICYEFNRITPAHAGKTQGQD